MLEEPERLCHASLIPRRMLRAGRSVAASRDARPRRLEICFPEGFGCGFPRSLGPERRCLCAARLAACSCLAPSFIPLLRLFCIEISHPVPGLSSGPAGGGAHLGARVLDVRVPGYQDARVLACWVLGCWMSECQGAGCQDARVPGCWMPQCQGAGCPGAGCQSARVLGARMPGCWVPGCRSAGCQSARVLGCRMPQCQGAGVLGARVLRCPSAILAAPPALHMPGALRRCRAGR